MLPYQVTWTVPQKNLINDVDGEKENQARWMHHEMVSGVALRVFKSHTGRFVKINLCILKDLFS